MPLAMPRKRRRQPWGHAALVEAACSFIMDNRWTLAQLRAMHEYAIDPADVPPLAPTCAEERRDAGGDVWADFVLPPPLTLEARRARERSGAPPAPLPRLPDGLAPQNGGEGGGGDLK